MNAFFEQPALVLRDVVESGDSLLFQAEDAAPAEEQLLARLEEMPEGGLLPVDFAGVRVSSEAARQLLRRAVRRTTGGELPDRYLVIFHPGRSQYNIQVMLETEGITIAERRDAAARLLGKVEPAMRETYDFLLSRKTATAKDVFEHFGLNNISTATNRLTALSKSSLARRIDEQAVAGGGRQFVYAAVR